MEITPRVIEVSSENLENEFIIKNKSDDKDAYLLYKITRSEPKYIIYTPKKAFIEFNKSKNVSIKMTNQSIRSIRILIKIIIVNKNDLLSSFNDTWNKAISNNIHIHKKIVEIVNKDVVSHSERIDRPIDQSLISNNSFNHSLSNVDIMFISNNSFNNEQINKIKQALLDVTVNNKLDYSINNQVNLSIDSKEDSDIDKDKIKKIKLHQLISRCSTIKPFTNQQLVNNPSHVLLEITSDEINNHNIFDIIRYYLSSTISQNQRISSIDISNSKYFDSLYDSIGHHYFQNEMNRKEDSKIDSIDSQPCYEAIILADNLTNLNITHTSIQSIDLTVSYFKKLISLDLSHNNISSISQCIYLPSLTYLNLSFNKLQSLDYLQELIHLKVLLVNNNSLNSLSHSIDMLVMQRDSLTTIDMSYNPVCSDLRYTEEVLRVLPNIQYFDKICLSSLKSYPILTSTTTRSIITTTHKQYMDRYTVKINKYERDFEKRLKRALKHRLVTNNFSSRSHSDAVSQMNSFSNNYSSILSNRRDSSTDSYSNIYMDIPLASDTIDLPMKSSLKKIDKQIYTPNSTKSSRHSLSSSLLNPTNSLKFYHRASGTAISSPHSNKNHRYSDETMNSDISIDIHDSKLRQGRSFHFDELQQMQESERYGIWHPRYIIPRRNFGYSKPFVDRQLPKNKPSVPLFDKMVHRLRDGFEKASIRGTFPRASRGLVRDKNYIHTANQSYDDIETSKDYRWYNATDHVRSASYSPNRRMTKGQHRSRRNYGSEDESVYTYSEDDNYSGYKKWHPEIFNNSFVQEDNQIQHSTSTTTTTNIYSDLNEDTTNYLRVDSDINISVNNKNTNPSYDDNYNDNTIDIKPRTDIKLLDVSSDEFDSLRDSRVPKPFLDISSIDVSNNPQQSVLLHDFSIVNQFSNNNVSDFSLIKKLEDDIIEEDKPVDEESQMNAYLKWLDDQQKRNSTNDNTNNDKTVSKSIDNSVIFNNSNVPLKSILTRNSPNSKSTSSSPKKRSNSESPNRNIKFIFSTPPKKENDETYAEIDPDLMSPKRFTLHDLAYTPTHPRYMAMKPEHIDKTYLYNPLKNIMNK